MPKQMEGPESYRFEPDGGFPNSRLPLLIYRRCLSANPAIIERRFGSNGWSNSWRDGIFDYHHFHSVAHEVLGVAAGEVTVAFGGPHGQEVMLAAGDVVVIPAGVAHKNAGQSHDLLVVGAYPGGADYDIRRGKPGELDQVKQAISAVPLPASDPVYGEEAGLRRSWV